MTNCSAKALLRTLNSFSFASRRGGKKVDKVVPIPISARSETKSKNEKRAEKYPKSAKDIFLAKSTVKRNAKNADKIFPEKIRYVDKAVLDRARSFPTRNTALILFIFNNQYMYLTKLALLYHAFFQCLFLTLPFR